MLYYPHFCIVRVETVDLLLQNYKTLWNLKFFSLFLGLLSLFMKIIGGILIVVIVLAVLVVLRMRYGVKCIWRDSKRSLARGSHLNTNHLWPAISVQFQWKYLSKMSIYNFVKSVTLSSLKIKINIYLRIGCIWRGLAHQMNIAYSKFENSQ